jgi:hypothetical protein
MSTASTTSTPATSTTSVAKARRTRRPRSAGGAQLDVGRSSAAKRMAAAILEVLAGARTPGDAARVLGMSLPRYYQVETRALNGLLAACESRPKGRQPNPANETIGLRQENERLQREITRHQALARAAQRAIGLSPSPAPMAKERTSGSSGSSGAPVKKTRRRRMARALSVAQRLQKDNNPVAPLAPPAASTPPASQSV